MLTTNRPTLARSWSRIYPTCCYYSIDHGLNPLQQYDELVSQHKIRNDEFQRGILRSLQDLHAGLLKYNPPKVPAPSSSILSKLGSYFHSSARPIEHPQGIYLWGNVGCGKTMLMDMFYTTVPRHLSKKRIHFHAFMQDVHKRAHRLHEKQGKDFDTAPVIAAEIAQEANVLCFDEFQVVDIADAMTLRRLIDDFYTKHGVVTFMTSNRPPDGLYQDGIQRKSFLPCIEQIKLHNRVICLDSDTDYRKIDRPSSGNYFFPPHGKNLKAVQTQADEHADKWFDYFGQGAEPQFNTQLEVWGRPVLIPKSVPGRVAQFTFDQLCMHPLSAADYLEITRAFAGIVLTDIPTLSTRQSDVTRRFITFLDAAYDTKTKLACTVAKPFETLFTGQDPAFLEQVAQQVEREFETIEADSDILSHSSLFRGEEEKFAFARTLSRLKQMSSKQWLDQLILE